MRFLPALLLGWTTISLGASATYIKDVQPILNKVGCTSGPCHGGAKGKNGFKLSLRGYDPEFDYRAILHDLSGRRFNRTDPANSLVLLKPTQTLPHEGGLRLEKGTRYYETVLKWLSEGAPYGDPVSGAVTELTIEPKEFFADRVGPEQQLKVTATYADGSLRVVTEDAIYESNTPTVAEVSDAGLIKTVRKGEAAMLVRYEGKLSVVNVTAITDKPGFDWKDLPEHNYIDRFINAKLRRLKILPSEPASDAEFLRRVSFDLTGVPPTPEELTAFVDDTSRDKRARKIDELMARPEFINHWAVKWSDLLQVNRAKLGDKGVWAFREWIRESLAENKPYDVMVRELITARGSTFRNPPANFFRFSSDAKAAMETTTQLFLGVRMVCAQCHDHPFEKWTQNQYYQLTAFFAAVDTKPGLDSDEQIVYDKRDDFDVKHPKDGRVMPAKFLFDVEDHGIRERELRASLADWLTAKANPFFATAMTNRLWSYFFGRGIIEPVDDIRATNPATNPALLEALAQDFLDHDYDLRHLIRTIANSRTYQLSFQTNEWNTDDETNFSHAYPRRLAAEQLFDAIHVAAGARPRYAQVPRNALAQDFPDPTVGQGGFLDMFGRPERQTSCECERRTDFSLVQALNLVNGATIADAIADPDGRIANLVLSGASDRQIVDQLYMAALSRLPRANERDLVLTYFAGKGNRAESAQDLLWALLNSNAFLFNR